MAAQRIMQILLDERQGGAETLAALLHGEFLRRGVTSRVVMLGAGRPVERLLRLRAAIGDGRPDAILAHSALPSVYSRLAVTALRRKPVVISVLHSAVNDLEDFKLRLAETVLCGATAGVVAVSEYQASQYRDMWLPRHPPLTVIPNAASSAYFAVARSRPEPTSDVWRLLAVGRLAPQKDYATLVRGVATAASLLGGLPALDLRIAGQTDDEAYAREIRCLAAASETSHLKIRFLGSREDVPLLMSQSHLMVHAAVNEGHSIALEEAFAAAVPVVCSDLRMAPIAPERLSAWSMFQAGSDGELALALVSAIRDYPQRAALSRSLSTRYRYRASELAQCYIAFITSTQGGVH